MPTVAITDFTFPDLSIEESILRPEGIEIVSFKEKRSPAELAGLVRDGARIKEVHLYTIARPTPEPFCGRLTKPELEVLAATVRARTGLPVVTFD